MHKAHLGFLILALTAGSFSPASSQVTVGFRGGLNVSNLSVTENGQAPEIPYESRTGLLIGATLGVDIAPWLGLQFGGQYSQNGTKQDDGATSVLLRLSYVDLPLLAKVYVAKEGSPVRPYLIAGGFVGFETGCDMRLEGPAAVDLDCDALEAGRETTDVGAVFGGGAEVPAGRAAFTLDIEYSLGLRNIATNPGVEAHSRVLSIALGFKVSP